MAHIRSQRRRTSGSSSGQAAQTSSGVHPESPSSSISICTRESTAMTGLLKTAACQDSDTQRMHSLPVSTWIASGGFSPGRRSAGC